LIPSPFGTVDSTSGEGVLIRILPGGHNLLDPNVGASPAFGVPDGELAKAGAVDGRRRLRGTCLGDAPNTGEWPRRGVATGGERTVAVVVEHEAGEDGTSSMKNIGYRKVAAASASTGRER
jgi:hypothetical protein